MKKVIMNVYKKINVSRETFMKNRKIMFHVKHNVDNNQKRCYTNNYHKKGEYKNGKNNSNC